MTTTDLWPDIPFDPKPRGVRQILEEAGRGLKEKTNGLVDFRVWPGEGLNPARFPFRFRCDLRVDRLDYNYHLLDVDSSAAGFPVEVRTGQEVVEAGDEASLLAVLAKVFRSEQTKAVIKNLISMATE
jgi:hypothetical protein